MTPSDEQYMDSLPLDQLCKPLSAKDTFRKSYTSGGSETSAARSNASVVKNLAMRIQKAAKKVRGA